jgi:hypothetical protein
LQDHDDRIRLVIHCGAGGGIDAHPDQAAEQNIARETRRATAGDFLVN